MVYNLTQLLLLGTVFLIWMAGTAYFCAYLAKETSLSRMGCAQFGALLSLIPPLNILYIAFLIYKRSTSKNAATNTH